MKTFIIQHACGHEAVHGHAGPEPDRRKREEWLRQQPCPACWRERQTEDAAAKRQEWNLPSLEGTPEQVAWADVIRMKAVAHNRDYYDRLTRNPDLDKHNEAMQAAIRSAAQSALQEIETQTSAAWWIENRFDALTLIRTRVVEAITPLVNEQQQ